MDDQLGLEDERSDLAHPIVWWPSTLQWQNFSEALNYPGFPFLQFLKNSIFYCALVTVGTVISCAAVGYGFARMRFPGRDLLFGLTLATMMIPGIVTFIPTYVLFKYLHLIGTYAPLIVANFLGNAFFIFMIRQFFMGMPWELSDAAKVDGASEWLIFWRIMLPLVRPALMVVAVFTFLYTWNDFFGPLIYLSDQSQYPAIARPVYLQGPAHHRLEPPDGRLDRGHPAPDRPVFLYSALLPAGYYPDRPERITLCGA